MHFLAVGPWVLFRALFDSKAMKCKTDTIVTLQVSLQRLRLESRSRTGAAAGLGENIKRGFSVQGMRSTGGLGAEVIRGILNWKEHGLSEFY